ncbi:MAG TPA: SpoIID/LytB domain-containing protein, partial [Thermoanaerobaculia bacterium]|nr:SpoIID/LytB domain-containing protein [Thermoanaerobaculia bacterium]
GLAAAPLAVLLASCAPAPSPVAPPPPALAPPVSPTPTPAPVPTFPAIVAPALDVAIATDRASASVPAGDWLLRIGNRVSRRPGPLVFRAAIPSKGAVVVEENGRSEEGPSPVALARADGAPVPFGDSSYRGFLLVRATGRGTLHVIDRVGVEEYLKGVVPGEMGPRVYDEVEALKAQAVAARSYALRRRGDFAGEGYDLCATPRCQVYGGVAVEHPLSSRAVEETSGEVLLFGGRIADTLFTSTCGGRTENVADVFPARSGEAPYLASVACSGEAPLALAARPVPAKPHRVGVLGARGLALLAALGHAPNAAGLIAARDAVRQRLGLPPRATAHPLGVPLAYVEIAEAAGLLAPGILTEAVEREAAPASWSAKARGAWAVLSRFQLANGAALPRDRALHVEEAAGLWASLLSRLGDFEEAEGRLVAASGEGIVLKTAKERTAFPIGDRLTLLAGGPDTFDAVPSLHAYPGDRVRAFVRGGTVYGLAKPATPAAGTYERDSVWIHWTRRFTGTELATKLKERDPSRAATVVRTLEIAGRGASGRAKGVRLTTDAGTLTLTGLEIRFALGLPESLFTVVAGTLGGGEPVFTFYGRGWGHGVGLCQNGAFGMALAGRSYREILAWYYTGATVGTSTGATDSR